MRVGAVVNFFLLNANPMSLHYILGRAKKASAPFISAEGP